MTNPSGTTAAYIQAYQRAQHIKTYPSGLVLLLGDCDFLKVWYLKALRKTWALAPGDLGASPLSELAYTNQLENTVQQLTAAGDLFAPSAGWIVQGCDARLCDRLLAVQQAKALANLVVCNGVKGMNAKLLAAAERSGCHIVVAEEPQQAHHLCAFFCESLGLTLSTKALQYLDEKLKSDVVTLYQTLSFLALVYADTNKTLEPADIAEHCQLVREDDAFALRNLMLARRTDQAVLLVEQLIAKRESALAILGLLVKHVRIAINIRYLHAEGRANEISRRLNLHGATLQRYTQYSRQLSQQSLQCALQLCGLTDEALKSSSVPSGLLLTRILRSL